MHVKGETHIVFTRIIAFEAVIVFALLILGLAGILAQ